MEGDKIVEQVVANTGVSASCAALINQKIIRVYDEAESSSFKHVMLLLLMPLVFVFSNLFGLLFDGKKPDSRFPTMFLIVLCKS